MEELIKKIRSIPDFPKKGLVYKDISPLLADQVQFAKVVDLLKTRYSEVHIHSVVGIEGCGSLLAAALAYALGTGCVMVCQPGKLPYKTFKKKYKSASGDRAIEIHQDALNIGDRVVIIDDVLATGATAGATTELIQKQFKAEIVELGFLVEIQFLEGRESIRKLPVHSLVQIKS